MKISYDLERERERVNIVVFKKYVDINNDLTSRLLQNVLLVESSVDEGYTNSSQNITVSQNTTKIIVLCFTMFYNYMWAY